MLNASDPDAGGAVVDPELKEQIALLLDQAAALIDSNPTRGAELAQQALLLSESAQEGCKYVDGMAQANLALGRFHLQMASYETSLSYFFKALSDFQSLKQPENEARALSYIGVNYAYIDDFPTALQYFYHALQKAQDQKMALLEGELLNDIGFTHVIIREPRKAIKYLQKSEQILRGQGDDRRLSWVLDSLCEAHQQMDQFDLALPYGLESVRLAELTGQWQKVAEHLQTVALAYHGQGLREKANACLQKALIVARNFGFRREIARTLRTLAEMDCERGDFSSALASLTEAVDIARTLQAKHVLISCFKTMVEVYKNLHDYQKALHYFETYHQMKEQIFNEKTDLRVKNLQVLYQLENARKEAEIFHLKYITLQKEIEERKKIQDRLEEMANTDALTGLLNRRSFFDKAETVLNNAFQTRRPVSVVLFDVDFFKQVNDTYGHLVGDQALTMLGERVRKIFRKDDLKARYGGEEFIVMMDGAGLDQACEAAERLRENIIIQPLIAEKVNMPITLSIGIAVTDGSEALSLDDLVENADIALYRAKLQGRNQVSS